MLGTSLAIGLALIYLLFGGCTNHTPSPPPPHEASNVHFREYKAWQTWDCVYRFDAPPQVCERFAIELSDDG